MEEDRFIGKNIGKCRIIEKIGEGGTAFVYRAHNESFQMDRVIKILKPELSENEDYLPRFRQEAQLVARLDHPNILRVFDTGDFEGLFYIEMEYLQGQTLRDMLQRQNRLSEKLTLHITLQLVQALRCAHESVISAPDGTRVQGLLHRDIKPENIMITPNREVKLMDFGAAQLLQSHSAESKIFGTLAYMSPEQVQGLELDVRSDFFSLGIVVYEMFTGRKPFAASNLHDLMEQIRVARYEPVRKLRRSISPMTEEFISHLLERKPSLRPESAKEIEKDLNICVQMYKAWGTGARVGVPFSWRRHYATLSLFFASIALILSALAFWNSLQHAPLQFRPNPASAEAQMYLDKGRALERDRQWRQAVEQYRMVPEGTKEFFEAQARKATIMGERLQQITAARAILENLRRLEEDPYVDAVLGGLLFKIALYAEARERFAASLTSRRTPVVPIEAERLDDMHYLTAMAWDKEYTLLDKDLRVLQEAVKTLGFYLDKAKCEENRTAKCRQAQRRKDALTPILHKAMEQK